MDLNILERLWNQVQKPARYTGGELNSVIKDTKNVDVRFALCFPDVYEIGMSHLGSKILYSLINTPENYWCERVFAPDVDMEELMRKSSVALYGLESLDKISGFDFIGFTLQYELTYTTILNMLDLANIPLKSNERFNLSPIVIGGGPCACNPEPVAEFFDLFVLGEGEEVTLELMSLYEVAKNEDWSKQEFLQKAAQIQGIYVPSFYEIEYNQDDTIKEIKALGDAPKLIKKRIIENLDNVHFPDSFVLPYIKVIHDRTMLEVLRGCIHGCRFCQAGFIYRPYREKSREVLISNAKEITKNTGYEEISLTSLSTSDYSELDPFLHQLLPWSNEKKIGISLPSLRINNFSRDLLDQIATVRKSGLTFAPEAGTQRMRDVINKNITEDEIMETCKVAFEGGYTSVKLYFMLGLPTETMEDVEGIAILAQKIVDLFYSLPNKEKGKSVNITLSTACFVPKPFTPFEFEPQDTMEMFMEKQKHLKNSLTSKKIRYKYHDSPTSVLEAVLARGDRRLSQVVYKAWKKGSFLDGWAEHFHKDYWDNAMEESGLKYDFYANRNRGYDEISPWSHLDYSVAHSYFVKENKKAHEEKTTPNCKTQCFACGAAKLYEEGIKLPCQ